MKYIARFLTCLVMATILSAPANAYNKYPTGGGSFTKFTKGPKTYSAPELDGALAPVSILLIASLIALRVERRRKHKAA